MAAITDTRELIITVKEALDGPALVTRYGYGPLKQITGVIDAAGPQHPDRLRAILISSSTMLAGLLPLLAETSTRPMPSNRCSSRWCSAC